MKRTKQIVILGIVGVLGTHLCAADNVVEDYGNSFSTPEEEQTKESSSNEGKQWFYDAGLGLFLHWGIHSLMEQQPSWCMLKGFMHRKQTFFHPEKYYAMAPKFDPQAYNVDEWLAVAKEAGFTYAVMTTKHHDGYALWPSKYGDMNSGMFMDGRDLLQPYVDACRENGLRVGFYFSGVDWYHKDFPRHTERATRKGLNYTYDGIDYSQWRRWPDDDPAEVERHLNGFYDMAKGQIRELLTRYGKIDVLWFDGFPVEWPASLSNGRALAKARILDIHQMIVDLQPDIVTNNRMQFAPKDFFTPERGDGTFPPDDYWVFQSDEWKRKWELCNLWTRGGGWGWSADGQPKGRDRYPASWVLRILAQCRANGGNMLTNSGPTNNGKQTASFYRECRTMTDWMKHSRASVIGAGALENSWKDHSTVPVTTGDKVWYLHLFVKNEATTVTLKHLPSPPDRVVLLRTGQELDSQLHDDVMGITVPAKLRTNLDDVVAVYWK